MKKISLKTVLKIREKATKGTMSNGFNGGTLKGIIAKDERGFIGELSRNDYPSKKNIYGLCGYPLKKGKDGFERGFGVCRFVKKGSSFYKI